MTVSNAAVIGHPVAGTVTNPVPQTASIARKTARTLMRDGRMKPADYAFFDILVSYMNTARAARGDTTVWPSRQTIAAEMGYASVKTVDKHIAAVERAGLITKATRRRAGLISRNIYTIHPHGLSTSPETGTTQPPAQTPVRSPETVPTVVPKTGPELKELELKERSNLSVAERFLAKLGIPPGSRREVAAAIAARNNVRSDGWWVMANRNGTLRDRINELGPQTAVADPKRAAWHAYYEQLKTASKCDHGAPGGHIANPDGLARCFDCRHARLLVAA